MWTPADRRFQDSIYWLCLREFFLFWGAGGGFQRLHSQIFRERGLKARQCITLFCHPKPFRSLPERYSVDISHHVLRAPIPSKENPWKDGAYLINWVHNISRHNCVCVRKRIGKGSNTSSILVEDFKSSVSVAKWALEWQRKAKWSSSAQGGTNTKRHLRIGVTLKTAVLTKQKHHFKANIFIFIALVWYSKEMKMPGSEPHWNFFSGCRFFFSLFILPLMCRQTCLLPTERTGSVTASVRLCQINLQRHALLLCLVRGLYRGGSAWFCFFSGGGGAVDLVQYFNKTVYLFIVHIYLSIYFY